MGPFRTSPPSSAGRGLILRPRLLAELARRFETRLTTVIGTAGFGKTALLIQAVEQNQLVTVGQDIWVCCEPEDSDASVLCNTILKAQGVDTGRRDRDPVDVIVEAVWNEAPFDVVLILDDFDQIVPDSDGAQLVADLVQQLPTNGHLVIASRNPLPFSVSKLRSVSDIVEINQEALGFDDNELEGLGTQGSPSSSVQAEGARWPVLAALLAEAGPAAALDFLRDEILDNRSEQDQRALGLLATFSCLDDALVQAVTQSNLTAQELLDGLPLVMSGNDETWQLHPLWTAALADRVNPPEREQALIRGGRHLLERESFLAAGEAFAEAGDLEGLTETTTAMCFRPLTRSWVDESRKLLRLLPASLAGSGMVKLLEAFAELEMRHQWKALTSFEAAAEALRQENLPELEIQALVVASQISGLRDGLPPAPHLYPRAVELAETGLPLACSMVARFDAYAALVAGDPLRAMSYVGDFAGFGPVRARMLIDQLWTDAGYPEHVGEVTTSTSDVEDLAAQGLIDVQLSLALWTRGEVPAGIALGLALELADLTASQRISHQSIQVLGVTTGVALATGDLEEGRRLAFKSRQLLDPDLGPLVGAYVDIGEAAVSLAEGDEEAATRILTGLLQRIPLGKWPPRPYLHFLSPLYILIPETRPLLDSMVMGPAMSEVINATRALVRYRESGDGSEFDEIDWRRVGALRSNLSFPHLVEIALAAKIDLDSDHIDTDHRVAVPRRVLNLLAKSDRPISSLAKTALGNLPGGPDFKLDLLVLGPMELRRDGELVENDNWLRRERVRMLCGYLVHHPNASRRDVCAALWPDLDETKALSNLRVNLRLFLQVLEPDRPTGVPSWFLDSEGPALNLRPDRLGIDVVEFDQLVDDARSADDRGIPGEALELYRRAADLFRGDYLDGRVFDHWAEFERIRIRSGAALASARVAELLLPRGERETSMRYASRALLNEPLLERAHRCRIRAFLGMEDRGAAREAAGLLLSSLDEAGLAPEPDSIAILSSLGLATGSDASRSATP